MEKYERFFREADTDNSGSLTEAELIAMLKRCGHRETEARVRDQHPLPPLSPSAHSEAGAAFAASSCRVAYVFRRYFLCDFFVIIMNDVSRNVRVIHLYVDVGFKENINGRTGT